MKAYKLSATVIDNNRVRVWSSNHETLGDACGVTYLTFEAAEDARAEAQEGIDSVCPDWQAKVEIDEIEIAELIEGDRYNVASVAAVMQPLPEGQNVSDYFTVRGEYRVADENGVEVKL